MPSVLQQGVMDLALREHRLVRAWPRGAPYKCFAPLIEPPFLSKNQIREMAKEAGLTEPRLYAMGFPHNNCGGFCIKAGQAHFKLLLEKLPERYAEHEAEERAFRERENKDVAILRDRRGGSVRPLTLEEFRLRVEAKKATDEEEW